MPVSTVLQSPPDGSKKFFGILECVSELTVHGPEFVRQICERLSAESDDARCNELISMLRTALEEDREELGSRLKYLANRYLRGSRQHGEENNVDSGRRDGLVIVLKGVSSLISISKAWPEQEFES